MENSENCTSISIINTHIARDSIDGLPKINKQKCKNAGICTRDKCVKSIEARLPPVRLPNRKDEEAWGVKSLPINWVPVSKPSKIIEALMKKRQVQHETILGEIKTQFEKINLDTEAQIRLSSEALKLNFTESEKKIQTQIETINLGADKIVSLSIENFETILNTISEQHKNRTTKIQLFHIYLQDLEKLRATQFKEVLKSAFKELHKISYKLPDELQQYFEHEILNINQMLMSNFRCYSDLQLGLNLQAENMNRLQRQNVDDIKRRWREIKKRDVLIKLNERKLMQTDCEALMLQTEQGQTTSRLFMTKEQNFAEAWTHLSPLPLTTEDVDSWTNWMQETINGLDEYARELITLYKTAIVQVFNGYFDELQNLTERMLDMGLIDTAEMSVRSLEVCKPTIETVSRQYSEELVTLENLWDSVITELQKKLQKMYVFLRGSAHLWDSHFRRLKDAKQIVLKDLRKVMEKNDKATQGQEIKFNIKLDVLRQAATEAKLEEALEDVQNSLEALKNIYKGHYTTEVKVIEKYQNLVQKEVQILLAELSLFLYIHPKTTPYKKKRASQISLGNDIQSSILPQQMKQCEYQVDAVENWMFGLWEAIERYVSTCQEETTQEANAWISENIKKITKRLEIKLAFHKSRQERVKKNVYDIRLAELKTHSDRLTRHRAGAEKEIENIRHLYLVYEAKYINIIDDYKNKLEDIHSKMKRATNSTIIKAYIGDLNYSTNACNQKLDILKEEQANAYNLKWFKIRKTAIAFFKKIRLFTEEGNFNYEEAKKTTKTLKTFEKLVKKKFNAVKKEIQTKERKILNQVQIKETEALYALSNSQQEFEFNERASFLINKLQADIRSEAYNIKFVNKKLNKHLGDLENAQQINLGDNDRLDEFKNDLDEFVSSMLNMSACLYQPEPVINVTTKSFQVHPATPENIPLKASRTAKKSDASAIQSVDYGNLLFETRPTENDCFMNTICCKLYESLNTIQLEAKEFYGKHKEIMNKEKVQPSYDDFMKEVLAKYNFYHLQCEMLWLDQVNEFFMMIQAYQKFIRNYQTAFIEKHHSLHTDIIMGKHGELIAEITTIKDHNKRLLHQINDKLKPLHGYKKNRGLLEELQSEMAEAVAEIRSFNVNDLIEPYKQSQEEHILVYEEELDIVTEKLTTLYIETFNTLLNLPVIEQFQQKLTYIIAFLDELSAQFKEEERVSEHHATYLEKINHMEVPSVYQLNVSNVQELEEPNITTEVIDVKEVLNEEYQRCIVHVEDIESNWDVDVNTYESMFNVNVQKVLQLYSVKYDKPELK